MKKSFMRLVGNLPKFPPVPDFLRAEKVGFADIGARGGPPANWLRVGGKIVYICFEPDPLEARKIEQEFFPNKNLRQFEGVVVAKALGATDHTGTLHLTRYRASSSLLEPNLPLVSKMADGSLYHVEEKIPVAITTLDSAVRTTGLTIDFLKIDVQGYELEVLNGASSALDQVVGCELEVSFIEIYKNQPLFAEVDQFMRFRGFFLADLERVWWKRDGIPPAIQERGTLAYGNAVYLKSSALQPTNRATALKSSIICTALGLDEISWDIATDAQSRGHLSNSELLEILRWIRKRRYQTAFWFQLAKRLGKLPGRQTLARWLSLWARALEGNSNTGSDSQSWNRKTSW